MKSLETLTESGEGKREDKLAFENPSRGSRFEVSNLETPDLIIPEGEEVVEKTATFKIENPEIPDLEGVFQIARYKSYGPGSVLATVNLFGVAPRGDKRERVFSFRDDLFYKVNKYDGN